MLTNILLLRLVFDTLGLFPEDGAGSYVAALGLAVWSSLAFPMAQPLITLLKGMEGKQLDWLVCVRSII